MPVTERRGLGRVRNTLVVAAILLIGFLAVRFLLLSAADRLLDDWEQAGLPGSRPLGTGPVVAAGWPPTLRWDDLYWDDGSAATARAGRLEIGVRPSSVLKRSLTIDRVRIDDLDLAAASAFLPWAEQLLANLPEMTARSAVPERPQPNAVWFEIAPIQIESLTTGFRRIEGWAWSPRRGSWQSIARMITDSSRQIDLRIEGSGAAGYEETAMEATLSDGRLFRYLTERPVGEQRRWSLTGRDDGRFLLSTLLPGFIDHASMSGGIVDLEVSSSPGSGVSAEINVAELNVGRRETEPWSVNGLICVADEIGSLQDFRIDRGESSLMISAELPLAADRIDGSFMVQGEWEGEPLSFDGTVIRSPDEWTLMLDQFEWRDARTGPVQLSLSDEVHRSEDGSALRRRLHGQAVLGTGLLSLEDGWGTADDPALLRASAVPASWLEPLLPFSLPGVWSGVVDGYGYFHRIPDGWKATGTVSMEEGSIEGISLLEEIGSLVGGGRPRSTVRLDELSLRWSFDAGRFFADSMIVSSPSMKITGSLMIAPPDSIFGLLRVAPSKNRLAAVVLDLLGGEGGAIDIGIEGDASRPELVPLDSDRRRPWLSKIDKVRRRFAW